MKILERIVRIAAASILSAGMILGLGTTALAANGSVTPVADPAAPVGTVTKVTVTFFGDTKTAKGFTWYTTAASVASDLQVLEKTSDSADFASANALTFHGSCAVPTNLVSSTVNKTQEYLHKAEATGLKPGTTYYFRVGDASLSLWSATGTFTTAKATGAFTFLDLADPQAKLLDEAQLSASTFKKAVATVPGADFIALNGDVVDTGSNEYQWDWLFDNMASVLGNYTIAPVAGNHESNSYSFIDHFDLQPAAGSATSSGVYYSFDYSNAHFVMLNNNENSTTYSDFSAEQVAWLKADVQAARDRGAKWIIAVMHKGPYTTSNHATDSDIMGATGVRTLVAPIMENLDIDLVLQGHDHIYAHSKPIRADGAASAETIVTESFQGQSVQYEVNNDGTVYLIPSTAGPKVYYKNKTIDPAYYNLFDNADESHAAVYGPDPGDATRPMRGQVQNFSSITINGDWLTVVSYEIDQNKNDAQPYVIDTFGILKDNTAPVIAATVKGGKPIMSGSTVKSPWVKLVCSDANLLSKSILRNGKPMKWPRHGVLTANGKYTIVAKDKAGTITTFEFTLK